LVIFVTAECVNRASSSLSHSSGSTTVLIRQSMDFNSGTTSTKPMYKVCTVLRRRILLK
uniref:Secreted protein n=1 Tax=Haemonchus placei TaxID=6290 RepID=A0A0N4WT83_HAEPC